MSDSTSISPTAHYTGYVWVRNGLSDPGLATLEGRAMYESLRGAMAVSRALGGPTLEAYLVARHRAIDALLERAIERHGISQVIEVASGLSPRGWRFTARYGDRLTYVEADLPGITARKREALARIGPASAGHRVVELDALRDDGPQSLSALTDELDREQGLAIITEGLLGYLDSGAVAGLWRRFASALAGFAAGRYISDLHLAAAQTVQVKAFRVLLSAFVRGRVHLHFDDVNQAEAALKDAGFAHASMRSAARVIAEEGGRTQPRARGSGLAHIIEASTR